MCFNNLPDFPTRELPNTTVRIRPIFVIFASIEGIAKLKHFKYIIFNNFIQYSNIYE